MYVYGNDNAWMADTHVIKNFLSMDGVKFSAQPRVPQIHSHPLASSRSPAVALKVLFFSQI